MATRDVKTIVQMREQLVEIEFHVIIDSIDTTLRQHASLLNDVYADILQALPASFLSVT